MWLAETEGARFWVGVLTELRNRGLEDIFIACMDGENLWNARRMTGGDPDDKIRMLLDRQIDDPWYTDDFETAYQDILEGMGKQFDSKLEACYKKARPEFEAYYSSGQD